jgi:hypothetical protein
LVFLSLYIDNKYECEEGMHSISFFGPEKGMCLNYA